MEEEEGGSLTRVPVPGAGVAHHLSLHTYKDEVRLMGRFTLNLIELKLCYLTFRSVENQVEYLYMV